LFEQRVIFFRQALQLLQRNLFFLLRLNKLIGKC
jgi:hypothetical protein